MAFGQTVDDDVDALGGESGGACSTETTTRRQNECSSAAYSEIDIVLLTERDRPVHSHIYGATPLLRQDHEGEAPLAFISSSTVSA